VRRGTRETIERGIYKDVGGYEVVARAGTLRRSQRFPLRTSLQTLRGWRDLTTSDLRDERQPTADASTLAGAIDSFIAKTKLPRRAGIRPSLHAWAREYGERPRRKITAALCQQALERWRHAGYSPQSLYYRRLALYRLWKTLDGPTVKTPVDDIHIARPRVQRPTWVPDDVILSVLMELRRKELAGGKLRRSAKTRARFLVLATTGQRPAQLKRAQRSDVDLERGIWWVRPAKGGHAVPLHLNSEMLDAWKAFVAADAWSHYDTRSFARTLRACGWPKGIRPYNLRHAAGLTLSARGADLGDIQMHMGHTSIATTRQFYVPGLDERMKATSAALEGRFRDRATHPVPRSAGDTIRFPGNQRVDSKHILVAADKPQKRRGA
jgi:integrase